MDLLICLDVKGACISQQYHQTLKRRTGIFQNTLKWSLSSSLASAVPSKPSQERLASRFLAQQPVALSGAPRPVTALSGRAVARFSESKLFEIAMTLLRLEKRTFYRSFLEEMSSCLQDDYISSKTTHPHCRCILRFFSTAQTPQRFGITSPFSSLMRFVTWRGALTWLGARHSISELKSLVVGCMIPTKKKCLIFYQFVLFPAIYGCLLKLSFCQRIHGPWKIETYIILTILMVMM